MFTPQLPKAWGHLAIDPAPCPQPWCHRWGQRWGLRAFLRAPVKTWSWERGLPLKAPPNPYSQLLLRTYKLVRVHSRGHMPGRAGGTLASCVADGWGRTGEGGPQGWGRAPGPPSPSPAQHADRPHSTGQGIKPCSPSTPASGLQETPSHFPPLTPAPTSPAMQPPTNPAPPGSPPPPCQPQRLLLKGLFAREGFRHRRT